MLGWRRCRAVDLVFLDPDNGLGVASQPAGGKGSSEYVLWFEIEQLRRGESSILVYWHCRCEPHDAFTARLADEVRRQAGACFLERPDAPRVLLLLAARAWHVESVRVASRRRFPDSEAKSGVAVCRQADLMARPACAARYNR